MAETAAARAKRAAKQAAEIEETPATERPCDKNHHVSIQTDGVTLGDKVYVYGEEFDCKPGTEEWGFVHNVAGVCALDLTTNEQVKKYGKILFEPGPWKGLGYDLDAKDETTGQPLLTDKDREALAVVNAERGLEA